MSDDKDLAQAKVQLLDIKPGDLFRHYKGGEYEVLNIAVKEDTLETLVVYRSLAKGYVWVRTLENWNEFVDVNGKTIKRFEKVTE